MAEALRSGAGVSTAPETSKTTRRYFNKAVGGAAFVLVGSGAGILGFRELGGGSEAPSEESAVIPQNENSNDMESVAPNKENDIRFSLAAERMVGDASRMFGRTPDQLRSDNTVRHSKATETDEGLAREICRMIANIGAAGTDPRDFERLEYPTDVERPVGILNDYRNKFYTPYLRDGLFNVKLEGKQAGADKFIADFLMRYSIDFEYSHVDYEGWADAAVFVNFDSVEEGLPTNAFDKSLIINFKTSIPDIQEGSHRDIYQWSMNVGATRNPATDEYAIGVSYAEHNQIQQ